MKIRPDKEKKYNSPWNIAADFKVDLTFNPKEIATMLVDYSTQKKIKQDTSLLSEKLYYYTMGHPYLVSMMCKIIDEEILPGRSSKDWLVTDVQE